MLYYTQKKNFNPKTSLKKPRTLSFISTTINTQGIASSLVTSKLDTRKFGLINPINIVTGKDLASRFPLAFGKNFL